MGVGDGDGDGEGVAVEVLVDVGVGDEVGVRVGVGLGVGDGEGVEVGGGEALYIVMFSTLAIPGPWKSSPSGPTINRRVEPVPGRAVPFAN